MRRRAIGFAAVVVVVFGVVSVITITHIAGAGGGCSISVPAPNLPPQLRALGGFDQSFDANNPEALAQVAVNAAGAIDANLDGATPLEPVRVAAVDAGRPAALVVPLETQQPAGATARIAGLVSFFEGCGGRATFGTVEDLPVGGTGSGPSAFPGVSEATAVAELGTSTPQLVYTTSPFNPEWRNPQSGATVAADE